MPNSFHVCVGFGCTANASLLLNRRVEIVEDRISPRSLAQLIECRAKAIAESGLLGLTGASSGEIRRGREVVATWCNDGSTGGLVGQIVDLGQGAVDVSELIEPTT